MKKLITLLITFVSVQTMAAGDAAKGKTVYKKVNCAMCHKPDGLGKAASADKIKLTKGPRIAGLDAAYIEEQVKAVKAKKRKNKNTSMMYAKIKKLTDADIANVAAYVSTMSKDKIKGMLQK